VRDNEYSSHRFIWSASCELMQSKKAIAKRVKETFVIATIPIKSKLKGKSKPRMRHQLTKRREKYPIRSVRNHSGPSRKVEYCELQF
jgi:hypothetical protein